MKILKSVIFIGGILYPFIIYFSFSNGYPGIAVSVITCLLVLRLFLAFLKNKGNDNQGPLSQLGIYSAVVGLFLCFGYLIFRGQNWLLYYPVFVNALLFCVFARSLIKKPAIITVFARQFSKSFPEHHVPYTEKVTLIWCTFFILNTLMSLVTISFEDLQFWALYNGFIAYCLIAILILVEFTYRKVLLR